MNRISLKIAIALLIIISLGVGYISWRNNPNKKNSAILGFNKSTSSDNRANQPIAPSPTENVSPLQTSSASGFQPPFDYAPDRITKKPFGIFIMPKTSPVQPEKFSGYHTGTDFEIFPDELNVEVPVKAVCSGKLIMKKSASGYGGVIVESCELDKNPITVVYGHLKLASISKAVGENISAGETLGILGADKSAETDGERKHLHLGFHKGTSVNISGYVQTESALSDWVDPCLYSCQ